MVHLVFKYSVNELPFLFRVPSKTYPLRKWSIVTDWQKHKLTHELKKTNQNPKTDGSQLKNRKNKGTPHAPAPQNEQKKLQQIMQLNNSHRR